MKSRMIESKSVLKDLGKYDFDGRSSNNARSHPCSGSVATLPYTFLVKQYT
jgi:hypothetical protein